VKADVVSPAKQREKEALQYAEEYFRGASRYLTRDGSKQARDQVRSAAHFLEWHHAFEAEYGLVAAALKDKLKDKPTDKLTDKLKDKLEDKLKDKLKDKAAVEFLREYAAVLLERDMPLPLGLGIFAAMALRNPNILRRRGPRADDLIYRNILVVQVMERIVHRWKFPATRNLEVMALPPALASLVVVSAFYSGSVVGAERAA
jgi:hypothetical protein